MSPQGLSIEDPEVTCKVLELAGLKILCYKPFTFLLLLNL
jgi:hypothetical protein